MTRMQHKKALELARAGMKPIDIAAVLGISVNFLPFKAYETEIKEAASCRSLKEMAEIISCFTRGEGEVL